MYIIRTKIVLLSITKYVQFFLLLIFFTIRVFTITPETSLSENVYFSFINYAKDLTAKIVGVFLTVYTKL